MTKNRSCQVIGVIQVKGGAGRSTVATNLAGELAKLGHTVLIDCDMPQGTSASWVAVRQQERAQIELTGEVHGDTATSHQQLLAMIERYKGQADYIVLDGPPRIAELTRTILMVADLTLIPVGASVAELWATADVLDIIAEAREVRPVDARIVWTRFRPNTRLAQDLAEQVRTELGLPILKSTLGFRVAYAEALGTGATVAELRDSNARDELRSLVAEVRSILKRK